MALSWEYYRQALSLYAAIGDGYSVARVLYRQGDWLVENDEAEKALPLYDQAIEIWQAIGMGMLVEQILLPRRQAAASAPT